MAKKKLKDELLAKASVKQVRFLRAYAECGVIAKAAKKAGCHRTAHAKWLEDDPEYPALFAAAREDACDVVRAEIKRRAIDGVDKPVFYKGDQVATVKRYSDRLLEFLAKSMMPTEFVDRLNVNQTGSHEVTVVIDDNWYGNNAHDLIAKGAAAPSSAADE